MNEKAAWGVLGMGVMGTSLSRNLARKGIRLALYNRFLQGEEEGVAANVASPIPNWQRRNLLRILKHLFRPWKSLEQFW